MDRFVFDLTKLLLYTMSILSIVLALTILILSALTAQRTTTHNRQNYAPKSSPVIRDFHFLIAVCIGGSISTSLTALFGIGAVYHESQVLVAIHALLLLLIHSCSLLIGSALFFDERQIGAPASLFFKAHYDWALLAYSHHPSHDSSLSHNDLYQYGKNFLSNITFDSILDRVHERLHCCGLMGTSDFAALHVPVPPSCFNHHGLSFESSCLLKFRSESVRKAQSVAICIYIMALISIVSFLIDFVLFREFLQDQLLERIIDRLSNYITTANHHQTIKPEVQQHVIDYLLESST